jgi:hypothetical protein
MLLIRNGHDKKVAQRTGFLEMNDMPGVYEIKCAMTVDNPPTSKSLLIKNCCSLFESEDFLRIH